MRHATESSRRPGLARLIGPVTAAVAVAALLSFGLVQSAAAATSHDYVWANGTTQLTANPGDIIEVDLTISGCDDGTVINGQGFTLLGWLGAYELQLPVAAAYANGTASFGPNWPLVTVAPTPLENTTYRIPFQLPEDQAPGATTFRMTNFQGVACSSAGGVGATMNLTIVDPSAATVADPPTGLSGTPGDGEVELSWTTPSDNGSPITGYRMEVSTSAEGPFSGASDACDAPSIGMSTATSCTAAGLDNGTGYYFRALTFNGVGNSEYSSVAGPYVPVPPAPDTPTAPSAVAGDSQATVTVGEPASGATPDGYTVTADPGGESCSITGSSGACTVTGLANGVAHTFTVTATNTGGSSTPSPASSPVTPSAAAPPTTAPPTTAPPTTAPPTTAPPTTAPPTTTGPTPSLPTVAAPSTPELVLTMDLQVGSSVDGGTNTVGLKGSGLVPGSGYTVTMFSTPRLLGSGTVDADGVLAVTLPIPADTEPGAHTVTVEALGGDGPLTASGWFSVDLNGRIAAVSTSGPVPEPEGVEPPSGVPGTLAFTGTDGSSLVGLALPLLLVGLALLALGRRRDGNA